MWVKKRKLQNYTKNVEIYTAVTIYYISLHGTICKDSTSQRVMAANWIFLLSYPEYINKTQTAKPGEKHENKTNRSNW